MSRTPNRWTRSAVVTSMILAAVPLVLAGCGGGSSNGSPFGTAPTPTPTSAPTPVPATSSLQAKFSQPSNGATLPPDTTYTITNGQSYTQSGYTVLQLAFGQSEVIINVSELGTIKTGNTFTFSPSSIGLGDKNIGFNYPAGFPRPVGVGSLSGQSGTLRVDSLVNQTATGSTQSTGTLKFTLANVALKDPNSQLSFTLSGSGQATVQNFGALTN